MFVGASAMIASIYVYLSLLTAYVHVLHMIPPLAAARPASAHTNQIWRVAYFILKYILEVGKELERVSNNSATGG